MNSNDLSALDSNALAKKLAALAQDEREHLVDFLRHLIEVDRRKLYLARGRGSLYAYCTEELLLSNGRAYRRVVAARLIPKYPLIAELLTTGRLTLERLALVRKLLTEENHREVLQRATEGTEDMVAEYVATVNPKPDVRDSIRKVPARAVAPQTAGALPELAPAGSASSPSTPVSRSSAPASAPHLVAPHLAATAASPAPCDAFALATPAASPAPALELVAATRASSSEVAASQQPSAPVPEVGEVQRRRPSRIEIRPTSADTWSVTMSVGREFIDTFNEVKAALSHTIPNGDFEAVFMECFRVTLDAVEKRRCGSPRAAKAAGKSAASVDAAGTPVANDSLLDAAPARDPAPTDASVAVCGTKAPMTKRSRHIPAKVRHAVWHRDEGKCAFVSDDGKRCGSKHQLDFHHRIPFAKGGPSTEENVSVRCRAHNRYEADLDFGFDFMDTKVRASQRKSLPERKCGSSREPRGENPNETH